ncbi:hypothetical protein THIOSC15_2100004 [uncultured Thiomicrorhabdus sp.]
MSHLIEFQVTIQVSEDDFDNPDTIDKFPHILTAMEDVINRENFDLYNSEFEEV